jgi:hypothetical protein
MVNLSQAMREAATGLDVLDAMIRRDGFTRAAQEAMAELRAFLIGIHERVETEKEEEPMETCSGSGTMDLVEDAPGLASDGKLNTYGKCKRCLNWFKLDMHRLLPKHDEVA